MNLRLFVSFATFLWDFVAIKNLRFRAKLLSLLLIWRHWISLKSHVVGTRTGDGGFILVKEFKQLMIIALRVKIIGVKNTAEKMKIKWKNVIIFCFLIKMITTTNYKPEKISIGGLQNKKSRTGNRYQNIPIFVWRKKSNCAFVRKIYGYSWLCCCSSR